MERPFISLTISLSNPLVLVSSLIDFFFNLLPIPSDFSLLFLQPSSLLSRHYRLISTCSIHSLSFLPAMFVTPKHPFTHPFFILFNLVTLNTKHYFCTCVVNVRSIETTGVFVVRFWLFRFRTYVQLSCPSAQSRAARNAFARFIDGHCLDTQSVYSHRSMFNGKSVHNKTIAHNYLFSNYLKYREMATFLLIV